MTTKSKQADNEANSFIKSVKSIDAWIGALKEDEKEKAIKRIYEIFIEGDRTLDEQKAIDSAIQTMIKERPRAIDSLESIAIGIQGIIYLSCIPQENKQKLALLYREALVWKDFNNLFVPETKKSSLAGWRQYTKGLLFQVYLLKFDFSQPLIIPPADIHKILSRVYGDLISLQNVSGFMRTIGKTRPNR